MILEKKEELITLDNEKTIDNRKLKDTTNFIEELDNTENIERKERPDWIPEKFWNGKEVNVESLAKSYFELEKKMSSKNSINEIYVPESYDINLDNNFLERDEELEKKLIEKGFSNEQTQTVYDLAYDYFNPLLENIQNLESKINQKELENYFGGKSEFSNISEILSKWSSANISKDISEHLCSSVEGIKTLHKMMLADQEYSINDLGSKVEFLDENKLNEMMNDTRYWRDKDPNFIMKVQEGFKKLYPDK